MPRRRCSLGWLTLIALGITTNPASCFVPSRLSQKLRARRSQSGSGYIKATSKDDTPKKKTLRINPLYTGLATAETIFWYCLAPGIDPDSRWFNSVDGELITQCLLNPNIVWTTPGYAFSSLLLNSFLILPAVWSLLLLQEDPKDQILPPLPFCLAGFLVGGGALVPYMMFRQRQPRVNPASFSPVLQAFESPAGPVCLQALLVLILTSFAVSFSDWNTECQAFADRLQSSQFTSLALLDFCLISIVIVDPLLDDAERRGYVLPADRNRLARISPFLVPLIGPVAWISIRPKYKV